MPQDLPGFYYDAEKNRYFPIKGPIPGSSRNSASLQTAQNTMSQPNPANNVSRRMVVKTAKLLQMRELYGNVITSREGKFNFQEEYQKIQASHPLIWKYHETERIGDAALEQIHVDVDMPNGLTGADILLAGGVSGSLSLYKVGNGGEQFYDGVNCRPDRIWPSNIENPRLSMKVPGHLWRSTGASMQMPSNISCVKMFGKHSTHIVDASTMQRILITTLGSETSGGSVYVLNLSEPLDFNPSISILRRRMYEIASFACTVWTADCNSTRSQAVIGTNLGAAIVNLETGRPSWVCRCKSDILSLQLDPSGNNVLCGLRNGAIVTVDARQKPEEFSTPLTRHRISYPSCGTSVASSRSDQKLSTQRFELKGNIYHTRNIFMPSSISCLVSLQLYDQYFLASSMDGSIKLYDHRLIQRGPVQSYDGNVNSHSRIQLGVDPSEKYIMSGGEDCYTRLWSIKSGKLLFENKFMKSIPSVVCWPRTEGILGVGDETPEYRDDLYGQNHTSGAWLGSVEGLFYMRWS